MKSYTMILLVSAALVITGGRAEAQSRGERGWLGISYAHTTTLRHDRPEHTLVVAAVLANSPAARAGVARGDTVITLNGTPMNRASVAPLARHIRPGEKVRLRLRRAGKVRDVEIVAGHRPEGTIVVGPAGRARMLNVDSVRAFTRLYVDSATAGMRDLPARLHAVGRGFEEVSVYRMREIAELRELAPRGASVFTPGPDFAATFTPGVAGSYFFDTGRRAVAGAEFFELNEALATAVGRKHGLLVLQVAERTPAAIAGLRAGDVVIRAAGHNVRRLNELRQAVAQARDAVSLRVVRNGKMVDITLASAN